MYRLYLYVEDKKLPKMIFYSDVVPRIGETIYNHEGEAFKTIDVHYIVDFGVVKDIERSKVKNICLICSKL